MSSRGGGGSRPSSGRRQQASPLSSSEHENIVLLRAAAVEKQKMNDMVEMLKERLADAEDKVMRPQEPAIASEEIPEGLTLAAAWSKIAIQQDNNRALRQALDDTVKDQSTHNKIHHSDVLEKKDGGAFAFLSFQGRVLVCADMFPKRTLL